MKPSRPCSALNPCEEAGPCILTHTRYGSLGSDVNVILNLTLDMILYTREVVVIWVQGSWRLDLSLFRGLLRGIGGARCTEMRAVVGEWQGMWQYVKFGAAC